jgi:hypothetical protein
LILLPNDSSAGAGAAKLVRIVRTARAANPMAIARRLAVFPSAGGEPRGPSSDVLRGPSTSLRSARDDTPEFATPSPARPEQLCSGECRHPCSQAGSFR